MKKSIKKLKLEKQTISRLSAQKIEGGKMAAFSQGLTCDCQTSPKNCDRTYNFKP